MLMVKSIWNTEKALGSSEKKPSASEKKNIPLARKSIVVATAIRKGEVLTVENITCKRPGTGISPIKWDEVIGSKAQKSYNKDEVI